MSYTDTLAEFTTTAPNGTPEATAQRFADLWGSRVEWVQAPTTFRLAGCRATFRVIPDGEFYSVHEVRGEPCSRPS